jgi:hypothetical protein
VLAGAPANTRGRRRTGRLDEDPSFLHPSHRDLLSFAAFPLEHSPQVFDEKSQARYKSHYRDGDEYDPSNYPDNCFCPFCASFFA